MNHTMFTTEILDSELLSKKNEELQNLKKELKAVKEEKEALEKEKYDLIDVLPMITYSDEETEFKIKILTVEGTTIEYKDYIIIHKTSLINSEINQSIIEAIATYVGDRLS